MCHENGKRPNLEVEPRATRRTFTAEYKRRILAEADVCPRGEVGALLRREGLYYSHLAQGRGGEKGGGLGREEPGRGGHPRARAGEKGGAGATTSQPTTAP